MKVVSRQEKGNMLSQMSYGQVFKIPDEDNPTHLFIKVEDTEDLIDDTTLVLVVDLETGGLEGFSATTPVIPVNASVVVED